MAAKEESPILSHSPLNFSGIKEKLDQIGQLNDVESANDPEDQPFKSKYAARELLEDLRKQLDNFIESSSSSAASSVEVSSSEAHLQSPSTLAPRDSNATGDVVSPDAVQIDCDDENTEQVKVQQLTPVFRVEIFLRYIEGRLGLNYIECEETGSGEEHLQRALRLLVTKYDVTSPAVSHVHMFLLNQIGILQAARRQIEKATEILHQAEATYSAYKEKHSEAPMSPSDLISSLEGE